MKGGYAVIGKLYEKLAPEMCAFLLRHSFAAKVPKGTFLMKQGVAPEHVIILKAGKVKISVPDSCCDMALDGEDCERVFGLYAALSGEKPNVDVVCTGDCEVTLMRKDIFETAVQRNPGLEFTVATMLGSESTTAHQILANARRYSRFES